MAILSARFSVIIALNGNRTFWRIAGRWVGGLDGAASQARPPDAPRQAQPQGIPRSAGKSCASALIGGRGSAAAVAIVCAGRSVGPGQTGQPAITQVVLRAASGM